MNGSPAIKSMAGRSGRFGRLFTTFSIFIGGLTLFGMTILCVWNVIIMRKLLNDPIVGAEDILTLMLVSFVAICIPFGAKSGSHIEIEAASSFLSEKADSYVKAFARTCGFLFLSFMSWQLWHAGTKAASFGEVTLQLAISYGPFYYLLSVCFGAFALFQLSDAIVALAATKDDMQPENRV